MTAAATDRWTRLRLVFGKTGRLRFLGQLDLARTLDRAVRRARLPVRFTEGFNPHVRLSFPCASPTGMESLCELAEIQVEVGTAADAVRDALREDLPEGLPVHGAEPIPEGERLRVRAAGYAVRAREGGDPLPDAAEVAALLARETIDIDRRGRATDLRPFLEELVAGTDGLRMRLRFEESGRTVRPENVLAAFDRDPLAFRLARLGMRVELRTRGEAGLRDYGEVGPWTAGS